MDSSSHASDRPIQVAENSRRASFEKRILIAIILLALPGLLISGVLIALEPWAIQAKLTLLGLEIFFGVFLGISLRDRIIRPLQTLANVVRALREQDYSFRTRSAVSTDALGELSLEVNALTDFLSQTQTGALEATALVQRVIEEVQAPIFTFDRAQRLQLVNTAAQKLLRNSAHELLNKTASELGLDCFLSCDNETTISFPAGSVARWFVRRGEFREQGVPHTLLVLSDVSRALREEERSAWQRLIRVIGHELNNSLAPIQSIAGSLNTRLPQAISDADQRQDFVRGLDIIETRSASLNRFLQAYRQLAQLPVPNLRDYSITTLMQRVSSMEDRVEVTIRPGAETTLAADPDQLEQMLINLLRNAADSVLQRRASERHSTELASGVEKHCPPIVLSWRSDDNAAIVTIEDCGVGLINPGNAFVPFYTTKPTGSGIGLLLSRQICEAHGGSLELTNRSDEQGCVAKVILPKRSNSGPSRSSH